MLRVLQLLVHQFLRFVDLIYPQKTVIPPVVTKPQSIHLTSQPFAPVETNLDREWKPTLNPCVQEPKYLVDPIMLQKQALSYCVIKVSMASSSFMNAVLESKAPILSKKELKIENRIPDELTVKGDEFLLHQAMANLLQNAIDFSPEGGIIQVDAWIIDGKIRVTVTDQGSGIPDFALGKIFNKFFSLQKPDTGLKSTGLGLNFIRQVALLRWGNVWLENREGKGAQAVMEMGAG